MTDLAIHGGQPVSEIPVPFMALGLNAADIAAANTVLESGMLRSASRCAELEQRFAAASDAKFGLTCSNGTTALQLAYLALLEPGDEVLVPAWTFIATASMVVGCGCRPVFCDVLPDTYQIDVADAERRITPRTRAIACTHLYGCPVDVDAVESLAKRHNLKVIYDAAQAHLATWKGKGIGAFGDVVTYSFYATKNLGTGEGGMVTTNDKATADTMAALRSHGETGKYLHTSIGFNFRMNDITGAIGCSKLDRLPAETAQRRANAKRLDAILAAIDGVNAPVVTPGADSAWHLYTAQIDTTQFSCTRDEFCEALKAEGVPTAVHYPRAVSRQPALEQFATEHPPVADSLCERVFCLPMHHALTDAHFNTIERSLRKVAEHYRAEKPQATISGRTPATR